jgi:class 3 adenylate cyclase
MCAGGLPTENDTNPLDAVLAALEMQEFLKKRKAEKEAYGEEYFEMRIGIHTGAVVAGVVGKKKFAYDIWGDTVNLASRLESSGEVGMVNVSEVTYQLVKNQIYCAYRGEIPAKNKGNVTMYFAMSRW